jgi:hypothetical protein
MARGGYAKIASIARLMSLVYANCKASLDGTPALEYTVGAQHERVAPVAGIFQIPIVTHR